MDEITIVSGAGDLYDAPISHEEDILFYSDNIFTTPSEPMFEVWQMLTSD